jgi:Putative Na+/H+ antiporter
MYVTVGVLFVNISIGRTLTPYPTGADVGRQVGLDLVTMLKTFGWKAGLGVVVNAGSAGLAYRTFLGQQPTTTPALAKLEVPRWGIAVHVAFHAAVVIFSHHAIVFLALFLSFLGFMEAYRRYQSRLMIRR